MSSIGRRIREVRIAQGMTQSALACDGISAGYVSLVESGKRTPSSAMLTRFAQRLGVPVSRLADDPAAAAPPAHPEVGRVELNFARLALANGNPTEAIRTLDQLPWETLPSLVWADANLLMAEALQQTGQLDRAVATLEQLLQRCRADETWVSYAVAATVLTVMYLEFGDVNRALEVAGDALVQIERSDLVGTDEHIRLGAMHVAAAFERGDLLYATHQVDSLIKTADRLGSSRARGSIYWNAGAVASERGRYADAIRLTDRAVALIGEQEESRDLPRLRHYYAWLLLRADQPDPEEALRQLDLADADPALAGARLDTGAFAVTRGRAYLLLGDLELAAEQGATALSMLGPSDHVDRAGALLLLGDVGAAQLDDDLAGEAYREMELVLRDMPASRSVARLWRELGDSLRAYGQIAAAVSAYDSSLSMLGLATSPATHRVSLKTH